MVWQDREYNRNGGRGDDYLSNPAAILGLSIPFGRWFGVPVRLHFWLLLTIAMSLGSLIHGVSIVMVVISIAILLASLLIHDFGHRIAAHWVGGSHNEFILWPAGGMVFPTLPPGAWPLFVGYVGGMLASLTMVVASSAALVAMSHTVYLGSWNPLSVFGSGLSAGPTESGRMLILNLLSIIVITNFGLIKINLLPYYWFDGGSLLQSILWPWIGCHHAINVTCILGMLIAGPMVLVSLAGGDFIEMVFWALLFSSSFTKRREVMASGTGEMEQAISFSAMNQAPTSGKRSKPPRVAKGLLRRTQDDRREQEILDQILAKVSATGMDSLLPAERQFLHNATERSRRGDDL